MIRRGSSRRRGAAAVEFAVLVSIILVPVLLGMWEVGRMVEAQQLLHNAAREGARRAASGKMTNSEVTTVVLQYLQNAGLPTANATVTVQNLGPSSATDVSNAIQMDRLRITVTVPFADLRWTALNQITPFTALTGEAEWRCLRDRDFPFISDSPIE